MGFVWKWRVVIKTVEMLSFLLLMVRVSARRSQKPEDDLTISIGLGQSETGIPPDPLPKTLT